MNPNNINIVPKLKIKEENVLTIVFSSDDNYAPYAGVTIHSLLKNASPNYFYDIVMLDNGISEENRNTLTEIASRDQLSSIRFVDISDIQIDVAIRKNSYISEATYMRLCVPHLFSTHNRVLYLDSDIIVLGDISTIFNTIMDNEYIAAVHDSLILFSTTINYKVHFQGERLTPMDYLRKHIGFEKEDLSEYVNAGVLLFNIPAFRRNNYEILSNLESDASKGYAFNDQCIINILFRGHIKYLHQRWNMLQFNSQEYKERGMAGHGESTLIELKEAKENPGIIHYLTHKKPWNKAGIKNERIFWKHCKQTPFYQKVQQDFNSIPQD